MEALTHKYNVNEAFSSETKYEQMSKMYTNDSLNNSQCKGNIILCVCVVIVSLKTIFVFGHSPFFHFL